MMAESGRSGNRGRRPGCVASQTFEPYAIFACCGPNRDRQREAAELQTLLDSRQTLLQNAISNAARSDQIRSLVHDLDERIGPHGVDVPAFEHWRSWALSEAVAIDPKGRSLAHLNEWFEKFRLEH